MAKNKTARARESIILFTRFPQAGKVKTRLIGKLGPQGAADLHQAMTEQILRRLQPVLARQEIRLRIYFSGGTQSTMTSWLGKYGSICSQQGSDLGRRMEHAFAREFAQGTQRILLIGADCPGLSNEIISSGLKKLKNHALVLGPAVDGGYYLIGLRCPQSTSFPSILFDDIDWGSEKVLQQTITQAGKAGLSHALLPKLHDIDRPEDLVHLNHHTCS